MAEESKCVMCLTGKHPQWGEVEPAKMIDIRGEKRMRHEHTRDHMFTSLCVTEPAPDPQEPRCEHCDDGVPLGKETASGHFRGAEFVGWCKKSEIYRRSAAHEPRKDGKQ